MVDSFRYEHIWQLSIAVDIQSDGQRSNYNTVVCQSKGYALLYIGICCNWPRHPRNWLVAEYKNFYAALIFYKLSRLTNNSMSISKAQLVENGYAQEHLYACS
jgi:hypothetical protein